MIEAGWGQMSMVDASEVVTMQYDLDKRVTIEGLLKQNISKVTS